MLTQEQTQLIEDNISFAYFLLFKYTNSFHFLEPDDIESASLFALIKAARSYDAGKGSKFTTYAAQCIHNEVLMLVRRQKKYMGTLSIETPVTKLEGKELTIADTLATPDFTHSYLQNQTLIDALEVLDERERHFILKCVMGNEKQKELGERFGISQSYVSRLIRRAKKKMRRAAARPE